MKNQVQLITYVDRLGELRPWTTKAGQTPQEAFAKVASRQRPDSAYAAVIPRWIAALRRGEPCVIHGDVPEAAEGFWRDLKSRYDLLRGDRDRPLLEPRELLGDLAWRAAPERCSGSRSVPGRC